LYNFQKEQHFRLVWCFISYLEVYQNAGQVSIVIIMRK